MYPLKDQLWGNLVAKRYSNSPLSRARADHDRPEPRSGGPIRPRVPFAREARGHAFHCYFCHAVLTIVRMQPLLSSLDGANATTLSVAIASMDERSHGVTMHWPGQRGAWLGRLLVWVARGRE